MENEIAISSMPAETHLAEWFGPVLDHGARWCAPNLKTRCYFLKVDGFELPLTVNEAEWENSWVCSPYTHYVTYAQEEVRRAVSPGLGVPFAALLEGVGGWFRAAECNRVVMVNNWLMSTNPWPAWNGRSLSATLDRLKARWPSHALVFRTLNARESGPLMEALRAAGARLIPSRQVWWYDPGSIAVKRSRDVRKDAALLNRGDLERVDHEDLSESDFPSLQALYEDLYLRKYSQHNPRYSVDWLLHLWRGRNLRFTALRHPDGHFVGVEACGPIHRTMVSPIVGYDLSLPASLGLYRRLAVLPILAAREQGLPLNLSAGVGRFKAHRGGEPVMEYLAVVDRHLPLARQLPWRFIEVLSRGVLAPVVKHWRL